jgi:4'-phosphopantetheinyl transferase EntD
MNEQLFPDERQYVSRAVIKRQAEFGTARVCARRALARLGIAACSLLPNPDRSPRWPRGIVGSISHTAGCCAVAVTSSPHIAGLGLDIELDTRLDGGLEAMICTENERLWLNHANGDRAQLGKLFFSAKEAFYKCQYTMTRSLIDFRDVELKIELGAESFSVARLTRSGGEWDRVHLVTGKFQRAAGFWITTALLPAENTVSTSRRSLIATALSVPEYRRCPGHGSF